MNVLVRVVRLHEKARLPKFAHLGLQGDLAADLFAIDDVDLPPGTIRHIRIGIALQMPEGYGALVHDRSGLALSGITVLGGVIDPGYTGEIRVILANVGDTAVALHEGSRVCQMRLVRLIQADFVEVTELHETERGTKGFGSTGC
jgi:dUTP pyrophosphatase